MQPCSLSGGCQSNSQSCSAASRFRWTALPRTLRPSGFVPVGCRDREDVVGVGWLGWPDFPGGESGATGVRKIRRGGTPCRGVARLHAASAKATIMHMTTIYRRPLLNPDHPPPFAPPASAQMRWQSGADPPSPAWMRPGAFATRP